MSAKYIVTWDMCQMHTRTLCESLLPAKQWKGIIAVSRGGLFPAAILARELGIRHIETLCIASYEEHYTQSESMRIIHAPEGDGEGFIIIDDLVDTGNTARVIREMYPKAHFVTVFAKPQGAPLVDNFVIEIPQDTWIELPWDLGLEFVHPIVKRK